MMILKDITIEELIEKLPASVRFLSDKGIKCIACGEPVWGTLEDATKEKGYSDDDVMLLVQELNLMKQKSPS
ncbi:MAG: hypothetical protein K9H64_07375 [Bacteroidales bacterium]|nr:hypothetical protein [Bacteroidales bacterium]MCF8455638.1 hypothetical protein [Bacteroidales bacterium]